MRRENGSRSGPSEEEKFAVANGLFSGFLLEIVVKLHEGIVGIVKHELEVFEEFILVGGHDVRQEGVAVLPLKTSKGLLLQGETPEGNWSAHLLGHWRGRLNFLLQNSGHS